MQWKEITIEETGAAVKGWVPATIHYHHENREVLLAVVDESPPPPASIQEGLSGEPINESYGYTSVSGESPEPPQGIQEAAKKYADGTFYSELSAKRIYQAFLAGASHLSGEVERLRKENEETKQYIEHTLKNRQEIIDELKKVNLENERLKGIAAGMLKKYRVYHSNLAWHLQTNKPKGEEKAIVEKRAEDYSEIITDLHQYLTDPK